MGASEAVAGTLTTTSALGMVGVDVKARADRWAREDAALREYALFAGSDVEPPHAWQSVPGEIEALVSELEEEFENLPPAEARWRTLDALVAREGYRQDQGANKALFIFGGVRCKTPVPQKIAMHHERAVLKGRPSTLTEGEWVAIGESFGWRCAYCDAPDARSLDHVVALTRGGTNCANNVVPACCACNSRKGVKQIDRFFRDAGLDEAAVYKRMSDARARRAA